MSHIMNSNKPTISGNYWFLCDLTSKLVSVVSAVLCIIISSYIIFYSFEWHWKPQGASHARSISFILFTVPTMWHYIRHMGVLREDIQEIIYIYYLRFKQIWLVDGSPDIKTMSQLNKYTQMQIFFLRVNAVMFKNIFTEKLHWYRFAFIHTRDRNGWAKYSTQLSRLLYNLSFCYL